MLYRDSENGIVMGVCAGLSNSFDLNTKGVRIGAFICLLIWTLPTILVYFVAGFLMRDRPLHFDRRRERQFWQRKDHRGHYRTYRYSSRPRRRY